MCACRLPWSRHHPALALSRRLTEALSIFLVSSGEWGSGLGWGGQTLHPPLSFSAFLFFNKAGSKKKSSACGRERRRGQEPWEPLPSIRLSRAVFFQGRPLERVSEPALHTDASPLSHAQPAWGSWYWGRRHLFFLTSHCRPALFSPSAHPGEQGRWRRGGRTLQAFDDPVQRGCLEAGTPGPSPSVRVIVWHPRRPGPFQSPWH